MQIVQQVCLALGVPALDEPSAAPVHASHAITVAACKQPRGRHIPPVMSEFADITSLDLDRVPPVNTKRRLLTACRHVPAGSKLLSFVKVGDEQDSSFRCFFGCYRTKEVFLREAMRLVHPFDKFLRGGVVPCRFKEVGRKGRETHTCSVAEPECCASSMEPPAVGNLVVPC